MTGVHGPGCVRDRLCVLVTLVRAADGRLSPQVDESNVPNASVLFRGVCDRRWLAGRGTGPGQAWHFFANLRSFRKASACLLALLYDGTHHTTDTLHSCSESLCPKFVRAGRRGSLACQASPARRTFEFGLPHAAAPEALGREGGDAQFCVTSRSSDVWTFDLVCVVVCVCSRTGVGARAGALPHQAFGRMESVLKRASSHPPLDI